MSTVQEKQSPATDLDTDVLRGLREQKNQLVRMYEDIYRAYENVVTEIEYGEIPFENIAEELAEDLSDLSADDYTFHVLYKRVIMFLLFNSDSDKIKGLSIMKRPKYRVRENQNAADLIKTFGNAFGFIRVSPQNAREHAEKQRTAIRDYCSEQRIELKEEHVYVGPCENTEDFLDYAYTEMIYTMCNVLVVSDITRIGSNAEQVMALLRAFREKGITVYSAKDGDITESNRTLHYLQMMPKEEQI